MSNLFELLQKYNPLSQPASMTDIAFETGVIAERERIVKLLEAWLADDYADFDDTLALIKEENK